MSALNQDPIVSVVTPCLNAERFVARTIDSVLAQDYAKIEYIVIDGGSRDGTIPILKRYGARLRYLSARDSGAADAINRGFSISSGSILAWLNADDTYLPGAITTAVRTFLSMPDADVVYGEGVWTDEQGCPLGRYPTGIPYRPEMLEKECGICQPTAFFRREVFESVGGLDSSLRCAFDYDFWIRLSRRHLFVAIPECLANSRMHKTSLTLGQRKFVFEENINILRRHYGYVPVNWVYGYLSYLRDGRDQYFEPLQRSAFVYAQALLRGTQYNLKHPWKYWREWISILSSTLIRNSAVLGVQK